ncbi:hypothetical protein SKAU_G00159030 [Synaphobranchus kaupii]|uniref:Integrase catalytic domain-containing protein n=1 Tax=Synaphobranchus kaupii TaxID=118154 RepID=A0A9Q1FI51_SYNKA|nr:hypothetical protein SKAU_G00159030 [Synaphobranchus kaupii]
MALRRFISRRGMPAELYSDQGTNFWGGEKELREAFAELSPDLKQQLAKQRIAFNFNPPAAPHFAGVWEWEIHSVKTALYTTVIYPETELLSRHPWRHSQVLADHFWSSFIRNYLPCLQTHQKWHVTPADITADSVVMLMDPQLPRSFWPIKHVTKVHPSADGHVRSVNLRIGDREYTRLVVRLVVLPAIPADQDDSGIAPP